MLDLGLVKNIPIREGHRLQFRAEAFNAFNHPSLDNPNGNLNTPNLGRILGSNSPRVFQLALKYNF